MRLVVIFATVLGALACAAASDNHALAMFEAVRKGDTAYLNTHLTKADLNLRDSHGATLLMHAAAFGNLETLKLLVDAGADVNAHNDFNATALLWAARDPEKAKLLISHGADVNARSKQGRTPLMLASLLHGGSPVVALMLSKGAEVNVKDTRGETALGLAASIGDDETMRLLLAKGADAGALNGRGESPLILASKSRNTEAVRLLLAKSVDVNVANTSSGSVRHGPIARIKLRALHTAAAFGPPEMVRDLLKAGADVNARDSRGLTPLMFAVATEYAAPRTVELLLRAGADANVRDNTGETALDWAEKFGQPDILSVLRKAGVQKGVTYAAPRMPDVPRPSAAVALSRSLNLLQKSSAEFFNQSGCVGCHHQPLIARAQRAAKAAGIAIDEKQAREQLLQMKAQWISSQEEFLQSLNPGGGPNRLAENLLGLEAAGYKPDPITDSAIIDLAEAQSTEGNWPAGEEQPRPPITESLIASTARAVAAVRAFAIPARKQEFDSRIARARSWLKRADAVTTDDFAMRLTGLALSSADASDLREAAKALIALQHEDGGWPADRYSASDAFSTGEALTVLHEAGMDGLSNSACRRGVEFLLSTQYPDGSWHVRSRSITFQPYFESGFPFGHDQWISTAATAWAVQAIAPSMRPASIAAALQ